MFQSSEHSEFSKNILEAYIKADKNFEWNFYERIYVPYIFTSLSGEGIVEDSIIYAGVHIYLELLDLVNQIYKSKDSEKIKLKEAKNKLKELKKTLINLIYNLNKYNRPYPSETDENIEYLLKKIPDMALNLERKLTINKKYLKKEKHKDKTDIGLNKSNINIARAERTSQTNPDFAFFGFLANIENFEDRYSFFEKVKNYAEFLDKDFKSYIEENVIEKGQLSNSETWLLKHSLPFKDTLIASVEDKIFYGISLANIDKNYTEKDIKEKLKERLIKEFDEEDIEQATEELFNTFYKDIYAKTQNFHKQTFKEVFKKFQSFYRENNNKNIPNNILYEKYKVSQNKDFSIKQINFFINNEYDGIIFIGETYEDIKKLKTLLYKYLKPLEKYDKKFANYFKKLLNNSFGILWRDLLVYYDIYKDNKKFKNFIDKDKLSIKFIYDVFFATISLWIFSQGNENKKIPFFIVYGSSLGNTEEEREQEIGLVSAYKFFNSFLYLIAEFPFQTIRIENIEKDLKQTFNNWSTLGAKAKNTFLSSLKFEKTLDFKINSTINGNHKGYIIREESSNNVIRDYDLKEMNRKHKIFHIYSFNYENNKMSLKYIGNSVKLAFSEIENDLNIKLEENDYIITIGKHLKKAEMESLAEKIFNKKIKEKNFNYVRILEDIPYIRHIKERGKSKSVEGIFIYREDIGDSLRPIYNLIFDDFDEKGKMFTILYTPAIPKKEDIPFITSFANTYLVYHNEELKDIIEHILFSLNIYSSESYFVPYAKEKRIIPMNDKFLIKRLNKTFGAFQSVVLIEMLYMFKRLFKEPLN